MREIKIEQANIVDLARLGGATTRQQWAILQEMRTGGTIKVARIDGTAVALGCLYPLPGVEASAEACFMVAPEAGPAMLHIVRAMRLTIEASPYRAIVAICRTAEGARIVRALGFRYQAESDLGEVWGYGTVRAENQQCGTEKDAGTPAAGEPCQLRPSAG